MGLFKGNSTCPLPSNDADLKMTGISIVGPLTFQHLILIISTACTGVATILSLWLIFKHLHRYSEPMQQRQIIRIIFTPVVFSVFSALSILSYSAAQYLVPLRDLYEGFALASLFYLFTGYVAPDPRSREQFFRNLENRKKKGGRFSRSKEYTVVPGGSFKWFNLRWVAVFGYVFVSIILTIAQEVSEAIGDYCVTSLSPRFAHIWILVIQNIAVAVAVTSVVLYYGRLRGMDGDDFTSHKPLLKLISFKLIVFVNFIQSFLFSILASKHVLKGSTKITGKDWTIGIPALVVAVEQVAFAVFFHYSFRSREYHHLSRTPGAKGEEEMPVSRMGTFRAAAHAFNPWDLIYGIGHAFTLLAGGIGPVGNGNWRRARSNQGPAIMQQLEPMRGAGAAYQPQHARYQSTYYQQAPNAEGTQYLGAGGQEDGIAAAGGYERSRSRSRSRAPPLYQSPSWSSEREQLNATAADTDAMSMRNMI